MLAIIGVTQLVILPFVAAILRVRTIALHRIRRRASLISYWFNFDFVYGKPNGMDECWAAGTRPGTGASSG